MARQWIRLPLCALAVFLVVSGARPATEEKALEDAWTRLPAAEKHFAQGLKEFSGGRRGSAAASFSRCVGELPRHADAHYYLANIKYINGEYLGALAHMEESLRNFEFMQELHEYAVKRKSRQMDSYQRMLEVQWENTTSCRESREIESLSGELTDRKSKLELIADKQRAARALQKAHYLYFVGNVLFQLKRFPEAGQKYREAVELNPRHVSAYNNAAAVAYLAGDPKTALIYLEKAEVQGLEDNLNLELRHLILKALGRPTEGILQEDLTPGAEGDLGVMRFALAIKGQDPLVPTLYENCYIVFSRSSRHAVIIDPGVEDPRIEEFVRPRDLSVRAVLNTHAHPDHAGADVRYAELFQAPVFIHSEGAKVLAVSAVKRLEGGETLPFDGFTAKVLHTPGHSTGSVCFLIGDFLFSGDTLFRNDIGKVADMEPKKAKVTRDELVRIVKEKLLTLADATRVCPGHGRMTTIADEKARNPFLMK